MEKKLKTVFSARKYAEVEIQSILEDKRITKKRIISRLKYLLDNLSDKEWVNKLDGKSRKDIEDTNYVFADDWMVEVEDSNNDNE